jgi:DNA-binding beta-propeller fold protein YncE
VQTGAEPSWMTFDARTGSLYVANRSDDTLQVLDATRCSGLRSAGCRKTPRTARATANSRVLPTVHTIYQAPSVARTTTDTPQADDTLSFIDTRRCNQRHRHCSARRSIDLGYFPQVYVDPGSSTLYLVDAAADVVHLVDARRCNVSGRSGCAPFADVSIPAVGALTINPRTHTVYANQEGATTIAVLPGEHCNALDHTRCDVAAHEVELGDVAGGIAVDDARDTVYLGIPLRQVEALLPSAACDAGSTNCVAVATTFLDGVPRNQLAVPERHSLYVAGGFGADTLTVVDTAVCNVHRLDGCVRTWPKTSTPNVPFGLVYDRRADKVVVTGWRDSTVAVIDPKVCGAGSPSGCAQGWPRIPVGFQPVSFGTDWRQNTLYVYNDYSETVSLLDLADPCRRKLCVRPTG